MQDRRTAALHENGDFFVSFPTMIKIDIKRPKCVIVPPVMFVYKIRSRLDSSLRVANNNSEQRVITDAFRITIRDIL